MKKHLKFQLFVALFFIAFILLYVALNKQTQPLEYSSSSHSHLIQSQLSYHLGYLIWKSYLCDRLDYQLDKVIEGMRAAESGEKQLMEDEHFYQALEKLSRDLNEKNKELNLKEVEACIKKFFNQEGVKELIPNKLYYCITREGEGAFLKENSSVVIHYRVECPCGNSWRELYSSYDGEPAEIFLGNAIIGFREGLLGMREGEKRTLIVHPELAYGDAHRLEPNRVLLFNVELIRKLR